MKETFLTVGRRLTPPRGEMLLRLAIAGIGRQALPLQELMAHLDAMTTWRCRSAHP